VLLGLRGVRSTKEAGVIGDVPRVKLSELVGRFGVGLSRDARQCKALLADVLCGDGFRAQRAVLVGAVQEGIAGELLSNSSGLPTEMLLDRLSHRLQANRGISSDLARWSVECWAVALGVVAGGNILATFKMDDLIPRIGLAGADGVISAIQLDQLVLEARTRGVSEADARAYLSNYAAAHGWQLDKPPEGSGRVEAKVGPQPAAAASAVATPAAKQPDHTKQPNHKGIIAVLQHRPTIDRIQGIVMELQLDDEVSIEPTLDTALRRIREGGNPRVLILDLSDSINPIAELSAARSVGGADLKVLAVGTVNDVGLFRDLLAAGASDYLVKPLSREALGAGLEKCASTANGGSGGGLGQLVVFIGNRGGVGTTTTAVACAWLLSDKYKENTVLLDLDLHFGTVALNFDAYPGTGLCEALEQPSRIDALFVDRATVKASDTLRILAAEAPIAEMLTIDAGAIDALLYELQRKFTWIVIDLPCWVTPTQRLVLAAASRVVIVCERSISGLRDTIRLQTLLREHAPRAQAMMVDAGASSERATVGRSEFEKAVGKSLDVTLSHDARSAAAATNAGQPLPVAAPRSPVVREIEQLAAAFAGARP
jgi:pilus assembly protein CpaE